MATPVGAIARFGSSSTVHIESILRLSFDLPVGAAVAETEDRLRSVLPGLDRLIQGGLITLDRARVILFRPANDLPGEAEDHRIEGLQDADGAADL